MRHLVDSLPGPVDAVIVLGDLAGEQVRRPVVIGWAEGGAVAPLRLRRTVEEAVRTETGIAPGGTGAFGQLARLAGPITLTPQGALGGGGLSAVTLQASGERGPAGGTSVTQARLEAFGRAVLRSIAALDNGPDVPAGPRPYLVAQGRVVPAWAMRLLAGALLLPALVAAIDGLARVRRRRQPVARWLVWLAAGTLPFLLAAVVARVLGVADLLPAPEGPVQADAVPVEAGGAIAVALAFVLGWLLRPILLRAGGPDSRAAAGAPGAAAALAVVLVAAALAIWAVNPYTAVLLAPAVHLWILAVAPEVRMRRGVGLAAVLAGLLPFVLVGVYYARALGLDPLDLGWLGVLALSGGYAGPAGVLAWSVVLACGVGAALIAARARPPAAGPGARADAPVTMRGPLTYAGPGSLGGTESALRR